MRTLVVAPQPFFSPRGTPFSVYHRTAVATELGARVDLLTYGEGQNVDLPGVRIVRIPRFRFLGEVKIGPSYLKLFLDGFLVLWTLALLLRHRYQVVHAHEESIFYLRFLKPIFRFKLIYDMHSSLPQQLENFRFTKSRAVIGIFRWLENSSLRASDAVITICPDLARYALGVIDDPGKHFLIENSIFDDVKLAGERPGGSAAAADAVALPAERPLVVYAGTLEAYQGTELLIRAFAAARARRPDAFLLVMGGSEEQVARYRALAGELGLAEHSRFTGRLPQPAARRLSGRAAVLVSPRLHGTNTPLKIYEQLASGIPLVATNIYSHTQVLDDEVAFLAEPEPEAFAGALVAALEDVSERKQRVEAARRRYAERYARAVYVGKMRRLFERIGFVMPERS